VVAQEYSKLSDRDLFSFNLYTIKQNIEAINTTANNKGIISCFFIFFIPNSLFIFIHKKDFCCIRVASLG
jgi:hypothetical protein